MILQRPLCLRMSEKVRTSAFYILAAEVLEVYGMVA